MQLFLIFLSVIMLLISVKSDESITDLSNECSRGGKIILPLTTGVGSSDTSVTMIASDELFNCTIVYSVNSENYVMVVIQFPDWRPNERACNDDQNSVLMVSENFEDVCQKFNNKSDSMYRKLGKGMLSVYINNLKGMRTIKLTATSLKDPQGIRCSGEKEVECSYNSRIYCMNEITNCDGHNNCGVSNEYDENDRDCEAKLTIKVVVYSVVTVIVLLALFISLVVNVMPKTRRTFIYEIHEEASLFDPSEDLINIDINIEVVFPSKLEEPTIRSNDSSKSSSSSKKSKKFLWFFDIPKGSNESSAKSK